LNFEEFHFPPTLQAGIKGQGYVSPTPIQEQTIPPIREGKDLIGLAQTGTGKTAAFALPILEHLMKSQRGRVNALIVCPTRELAEQTAQCFNDLGQFTKLHAIPIYGGVGMDQQVRGLRTGTEIVVACPGRLLDHAWKGTIDLSHVEILVIDEADRMFDMGFQPDIRNIIKCLTSKPQTLLFSATMPPDIKKLVHEVLQNPVTIQIGETRPANSVSHYLYPVTQDKKTQLLVNLLRDTATDSVLIFTRTKMRADRVMLALRKSGFKAACLQGNMTQGARQAAMEGFRTGFYKILVATDIAARGIDVKGIELVINFDLPDDAENYVHRIGRTGRAGMEGRAISIATPDQADQVQAIERIVRSQITIAQHPEIETQTLYRAPAAGSGRRPMGGGGRSFVNKSFARGGRRRFR